LWRPASTGGWTPSAHTSLFISKNGNRQTLPRRCRRRSSGPGPGEGLLHRLAAAARQHDDLDLARLEVSRQLEPALDVLEIFEIHADRPLGRGGELEYRVLPGLRAADLEAGRTVDRALVLERLDQHQLVAELVHAAGRLDDQVLDAQAGPLVLRRDDVAVEIQLLPELHDLLRRILERVIELGEEAWRVVVSGAPSLDHLDSIELLSASRLEREYGIQLDRPPLLVTYHPVTLEYEQTEWQVNELLCALEASGLPVVFTLPNADTRSRSVIRMVKQFAQDHDFIQIVDNFGSKGYFSMMALALAMVGNSSSGIVEAPSFKLPVVNIGTRQEGRMKAINVIDVGYRRDQILEGIRKAVDPEFRKRLTNLENPYRSGQAARKIVSHLKAMTLDERLIKKHFADLTLRREPVASKDGCNS